jgi:hypothetical protein
MALVAPAKPKATVLRSAQGLEVVIPARRNAFTTLFLGVWLIGWGVGEVMVPAQLFRARAEPEALAFAAVWFVVWTIVGGFALYVFLWSLAGRERILLTGSRLAIRRELFGMGRLREYDLAHVRDLRVSPGTYNPFDFRSVLECWGIGGGAVAFDYGASTIRFGAALEEGEARSVRDRLMAHGSLRSGAA